jgi:hypothetical protein
MVLSRELPVGFLDVIVACRTRKAESLVIVLVFHVIAAVVAYRDFTSASTRPRFDLS